MPTIIGISRAQITFSNLEEQIAQDNEVRFIDAFVDKLDLKQLGIQSLIQIEKKKAGRASFEDAVFLKLYLYAYLNGLRSSRRLEKETQRNIELKWLLKGLCPNYHSIADFRKINVVALQNLFKLFVLFLKEAGLIGGHVIAVDGTKIRGNNSKKNNCNSKKIERHLAYIEEKTKQYLEQLDQADQEEEKAQSIAVSDVEEKLERLKAHKIKYDHLAKQIKESKEPQLSTTDPDARALLVRGVVVEVGYNVQAAVDEKHSLVVATHTINLNDKNALYDISKAAKENIATEELTVIADKGYHTGKGLQACQDAGIDTLVARQEIANSNKGGTQPEYLVQHFEYNKQDDTYTCPQGQTLSTTGKRHKKKRSEDISCQFKKYRTTACNTCKVKNLCTGRHDGRRELSEANHKYN